MFNNHVIPIQAVEPNTQRISKEPYIQTFMLTDILNFFFFHDSFHFLTFLLYQKNLKEIVANSNFVIPIYFQPNFVDLRYFKLKILLDQII